MVLLCIITWAIFLAIVIRNSRKKGGDLIDYSSKGSSSMIMQYFIFFTIFSIGIVIHLSNLDFLPFLKKSDLLFLQSQRIMEHESLSNSSCLTFSTNLLQDLFFSWIIHYPSNIFIQYFGSVALLAGFIFYIVTIHFFAENYFPLVGIKKGQTLCMKGPYKYIRHPLYTGQMFMMVGTAMIFQNLIYILLIFVLYQFYKTSREEEKILAKNFPEYHEYMERTGMFFPSIY